MTAYKYAYTTGNLGSFQDVADYVYDDLYWGDLLSMYNGQLITYDTIGNPLSDGSRTYTWQHGRELKRITLSADGSVWNFTYNADGMRTQRACGDTVYRYVYNGSQLSQMTIDNGTTTDVEYTLFFTYDAEGSPVSVTFNGTIYFYVTNLQGDVVAILDSTGATVVTYTYDVWGKLLSTTDTSGENLGYHNPLRYRGYVYDNETGLYYLQSRYYNPEIGRFINADSPDYLGADGTLTSYNLFAYCGNNPVMGYDPTGTINWGNVIKAVAIVVAVTAVVALTVATAGAAAAATGAVSASVVTAATTGTVVGGLTAGASEIAIQCATKGSDNLDYMAIGIESFVGAVHGAIDGISATTTSVTSKLACKGGKVLISAVGSMGHSINQGNGTAETLTAVGKSIGASILLQGALTGKDYYTGVLNSTMLEQNLLDGAMNYGIKQGFMTGIIRGGSNVFRNRRNLIPIVF